MRRDRERSRSSQAFAALHSEIRNELNPNGLLEEEAVLEVAELHWRKQRLAMGFLLQYYKRPPSPEMIAAAKGGLNALALHLARAKSTDPPTPGSRPVRKF